MHLSNKSIALLRSQDRVVSMLYHKTFPIDNAAATTPAAAAAAPAPDAAAPPVTDVEVKETLAWLAAGGAQEGSAAPHPPSASLASVRR